MLYVVGIGPGKMEGLTLEALNALKESEIITGYDVYVDLVKAFLGENRTYLSTKMTKETERCQMALSLANEGKTVSIVCSGDPGVYALSSLVLEMKKDYPKAEVKTISGVTAALSGGSVVGAPLSHDFAVISLSDLLTPYELIEKRVKFASMGDFCICLYNPASKKRAEYLKNMCDIMLDHKSPETVCAIVKNIGRDGEEKAIMTLKELRDYKADMFTTVFVGNSQTYVTKDGFMVTPRGYKL